MPHVWIGPPHGFGDVGTYVFRRTFARADLGDQTSIGITADPRYWLYLNGQLISTGPGRGDVMHWPIGRVDLSSALKEGQNILHAVVWNHGNLAGLAQVSHRTGLLVEHPVLGTPSEWEVAMLVGIAPSEDTINWRPTYRVASATITVSSDESSYADLADPQRLGRELSWFEPVRISIAKRDALGGEQESGWWLIDRPIPEPIRVPGAPCLLVNPDESRCEWSVIQLDDSSVLLDAGVYRYGYPILNVTTEAEEAWLHIGYAESLFHDGWDKGNRNETAGKTFVGIEDWFQMTPGHHRFEPLEPRAFRYLRLASQEKVEICGLEVIETHYPHPAGSSFSSPSEELDKIWEVAHRTWAICAGDNFDCPYYEELQYAGDTRLQALIGSFLSRDRAFQRNAIRQFFWSMTPEGITLARTPCREMQIITPFCYWWMAMVFDNLRYDPESPFGPGSREYEAAMRMPTNVMRRHEEGRPGWTFGDWIDEWNWGQPPGGLLATMHQATEVYVRSLNPCLSSDERHGLRAEIRSRFGIGPDGPYRAVSDPAFIPTEHAEALIRLALHELGENPPAWPAEALETSRAAKTTLYFSYYRLAAQALTQPYPALLDPWREALAQGFTTFPEKMGETRSDCHGWSAHPLVGLFQSLAGISSDGIGWSRMKIRPQSGGLPSYRAEVHHPAGMVSVEFGEDEVRVVSPVNGVLEYGGSHALEPGKPVSVRRLD